VTAEEIMALRLMMEKLIMHAGDCERRLALERSRSEHLERNAIHWAARAGKAEARVDTAAEAERAQIVAWMRGSNIDGVIEEACVIAADMIERGDHLKVKP